MAAQRNFESGLTRYKKVLAKEKRKDGIEAAEAALSLHSHRMSDFSGYLAYLAAKAKTDAATGEFYRQEKWRGWKFRMFCRRRSSKARFLNRVEATYGADCTVYYGDWSRTDQMKGCDPSPGTKKLFLKRFPNVVDMDKHKTSVTCNGCRGRLERYKKRNGCPSHSCASCGLEDKRSKRFVDRDVNAAKNILWVGTLSPMRPECLRRQPKTKAAAAADNPPVAAGGTLSDPAVHARRSAYLVAKGNFLIN